MPVRISITCILPKMLVIERLRERMIIVYKNDCCTILARFQLRFKWWAEVQLSPNLVVVKASCTDTIFALIIFFHLCTTIICFSFASRNPSTRLRQTYRASFVDQALYTQVEY